MRGYVGQQIRTKNEGMIKILYYLKADQFNFSLIDNNIIFEFDYLWDQFVYNPNIKFENVYRNYTTPGLRFCDGRWNEMIDCIS